MDAWDLVMRALSYYWRVTRQDNVVAQALLEKATAIDPHYGQALGVLAASHTFSAHMGWADMAPSCRSPSAALAAIRADSEDPWAHYAFGLRLFVSAAFRRLAAEFELALRLNSNSRWPRAITAWRSLLGAWKKPTLRARVRCG